MGQAARKHQWQAGKFLPKAERPNWWGYRVAVKGKKHDSSSQILEKISTFVPVGFA